MAKIAFTKLQLQKNNDVKEWQVNGQTIEVKQYLSMEQRIDLAKWVIQQVTNFNTDFLNEFAFHIYMDLAIVFNYTNLTFTDKQKEDLYKLYDLLVSSNFIAELKKQVNCNQTDDLEVYIYDTLKNYYDYHNSVYGIMNAISQDYGSLAQDAEKLRADLTDPDSLGILKETLTKLG